MAEELVRADLPARGAVAFAVDVTGAAREAEWRHLAGRVPAEALARLIAGATLSAGFLRDDERLSMQLRTEGHLRGALVDVDATGAVRGYTHAKAIPVMDRGPSDVAYAIGSRGTLTAIRSTASELRVSGTVELARGDVASDVEKYLETSEQRPSIVELATEHAEASDGGDGPADPIPGRGRVWGLEFAGGVLLQAGPGADLHWFEARRARRREMAAALRELRDPERVLARLFEGERLEVVARRPIRFRCRCSRERVLGMLRGLDAAELRAMIEEDRGATVTCHFCNDQVEVGEAELRAILEERGRPA